MITGLLVVLAVAAGASAAVVEAPGDADRAETPPSNFVGEGTNDLATAMIQSFDGKDDDAVFSPLGYSVVLAVLAEGAGGQTRSQLVAALRLAEDTYAVRQNYKAILSAMQERWSLNKPEFKNWFYVYKNYSVNENYKKTLLDNYYTEVKSVDRVNYELDFDKEEDKTDEVMDKVEEEQKTESAEVYYKSKGDGEETENKKEKQEIIGQAKARMDSFYGTKEVATALSANRIVGKMDKETELDSETKMIIFNGFYFRGNWKTPFALTKEDTKKSFYKSPSVKTQVTMMQASGVFDIGNIPELDAIAIELPYEGKQYSMLVLLPNQRDGLSKLTADITGFSLNKTYKHLVERPVEVLLPKCQIQTISYLEETLKKAGVTDVFTEEADLSGMSSDKLKMGPLVQLVNLQIDEGSSDVNFLTTTSTVASTRNNVERFVADHPFLFFIRDQPKNIIVAAGKIVNPKFEDSADNSP